MQITVYLQCIIYLILEVDVERCRNKIKIFKYPFLHNVLSQHYIYSKQNYLYFQSPRNGDDLSDGEPLETEERSHTPPPRMDSPEDNLTPQLKVKVSKSSIVIKTTSSTE